MKQTEEKNTERLLSLRRHLKERKPNFIRQDVVRKKTLKIKWRRPKGMHSKMRLHQRGNLKLVTKGYKSPQEVRGMLRTGLFPVLVHNVKELVEINTKTQSAVIGSTVGLKLKLEIVKKAIELKINLENVKHPSEFLKEKTDALKNKKLQKESKEKQQKEALDPIKLLSGKKQGQYDYKAYNDKPDSVRADPVVERGYRDERGAARQDRKFDLYGSLELMLYSQTVDNHIRESLDQKPERNHAAIDHKYAVTLSQGYVTDLGLNYLVLSLFKEGELEQRYTVMTRDNKEQAIEEERIMKLLSELLEKINSKDKIEEEDALESIKRLMEDKSDEEKERINRMIAKIRDNKKQNTKLKDLKLLLDKDRELALEVFSSYKPKRDEDYTNKNSEYIKELERKRKDFTNLVPHKTVSKAPISIMGGILGYTYLGENFMVIRDDLNDYEANEVEIHEAIHTPDEYETRVITRWMLDNETHYH